MSITPVSGQGLSHLGPVQSRAAQADPDGGADKAREVGKSTAPATRVEISQQARALLAATIVNDADHGRDGK